MDNRRGIWVVADGIGSCPFGRTVSNACCDSVVLAWDALRDLSAAPEERLCKTVISVDRRVSAIMALLCEQATGARMIVAALSESKLHLASVGDCRAYLMRDRKLDAMTTTGRLNDYSCAPDQMVGAGLRPIPRISCISVKANDTILLCTDGVWATQPHHKLERALLAGMRRSAGDSTNQAAIDVVRSADGSDDATAIVLSFS